MRPFAGDGTAARPPAASACIQGRWNGNHAAFFSKIRRSLAGSSSLKTVDKKLASQPNTAVVFDEAGFNEASTDNSRSFTAQADESSSGPRLAARATPGLASDNEGACIFSVPTLQPENSLPAPFAPFREAPVHRRTAQKCLLCLRSTCAAID